MIDHRSHPDSNEDSLNSRSSQLRDQLLQRQDLDWSRGIRTSIDQLIVEFPWLWKQPELILDVLHNEIYLRQELGETPELADYQARFPQLAEPLRIQWEVDRLLNQQSTNSNQHLPQSLPVRHRIGRYEIQSKLGEGGIGVAYKAWDPLLRRVVALKLLKSGKYATSQELARFRIEAAAIARVRHENVVQVYDVSEVSGESFIAMEYCAGGTLAARLQQSVLAPREAADIVRQIGEGVIAVHQAQIIHRDLKPANVFLQSPGRRPNQTDESTVQPNQTVLELDPPSIHSAGLPTANMETPITEATSALPKVSDFGLAKLVDEDDLQTRTGMLLGTPAYMAPEQAFGGQLGISPSVDVYALGAILYECLTGRPPFRGSTAAETLEQVRLRDPTPIRQLQPNVPIDLQTIATKCLSKEPKNRYVSVAEVTAELARFLNGQPIVARPISRVERFWRWGRRNPGMAALSSSVLALLICLTAGSLIAAIRLRSEATAARISEQKAINADNQRLEQLYQAYLGESRASRRSGGLGQRELALHSIRGIVTAYSEKRPTAAQQVELRDEALAALTLPDLHITGRHQAEIFSERSGIKCCSKTGEYPLWNRTTGEITVHRLADGKILRRLPGMAPHPDEERWFVFSECGTWLLEFMHHLPSAEPQRVRLWDWRQGRSLFTQKNEPSWVHVVAHPATKKIIVWCEDSKLRRFDLLTGDEESVSPSEFTISRMAPDPSGQKLAIINAQTHPEIIDTRTWKVLDVIQDASPGKAVAWQPSGAKILFGGLDFSIYEWEPDAREGKHWPRREHAEIFDLWYSPTGDGVAVAQPGGVALRDCNWRMPEVRGLFLGFDADGRRIAMFHENEVTWYERDRQIARREIQVDAEYSQFSPDGRWLLLSGPHEVRILETQNYSEVEILAMDRPGCAIFDPRGRDFVTFGIFSHTWVWPVTRPDQSANRARFGPPRPLPIKHTRSILAALNRPEPEPEHFGRHASFSADGQTLAIAGARNREILIWERDRDTAPRVFVQDHAAERVALSPDGKWLAGAAVHNPVARVWNYETRERVLEVPEVRHVTFSPDGRWLAMATWDRAHLYACEPDGTFRLQQTFERAQPALEFGTAITFSPDSKYLAMTASASQIRIIELATRKTVGHLSHSEGGIISWMSFSPEGHLASARPGVDVTIWDLPQLKSGLASLGLEHSKFPGAPRPPESQSSEPLGLEIDRGQMPLPGTWSDLWAYMAEAEISNGRLNDAIGKMTAAIDISTLDDWNRRSKWLCRRAMYYKRNHDYQQARTDLQNALLFARDSREIKIEIARLALFGPPELRDPLRVRELLAPTLLKNGQPAIGDDFQTEWQLYGCALIRYQQHQAGLDVLTQHPGSEDDPIPKYMQAVAQYHLSNHAMAQSTFHSAVEIDARHRKKAKPEIQVEWERLQDEVSALIHASN